MRPGRLASTCLLLASGAACTPWARTDDLPTPGHAERDLPRLLRGASLLGAPVEDRDGEPVGILTDVLIEPSTGEVVGVVVSLPRSGADGEGAFDERILEYGSTVWVRGESVVPTLILACTRDELARNVDHADLFDGQDLSSATGVVLEIEVHDAGAASAVLLKVQDQENLLHRVLVEPALLARICLAPLAAGDNVEVEGALTRDATGKLLVASAITKDGERLTLRDSSGAIPWETLTQRLQSARSLSTQPATTADGALLMIRGWLLDRRLGMTPYLCLDVDGVERALPWGTAERDEGAKAWKVPRDRAELSLLPLVSPEGRLGP